MEKNYNKQKEKHINLQASLQAFFVEINFCADFPKLVWNLIKFSWPQNYFNLLGTCMKKYVTKNNTANRCKSYFVFSIDILKFLLPYWSSFSDKGRNSDDP